MAHRDFENLYPLVSAEAFGCPDDVISTKVRLAAIEACKRTRVWRYPRSVTLQTGVYEYDYSGLPQDSRVIGFESAYLNESFAELRYIPYSEIRRRSPNWPATLGTPQYISEQNSDGFLVAPSPQRSHTLHMEYVLSPTLDAEGMEGSVMDELHQPILHYALRDIMVMSGTPWENHELASYHAKQAIYHFNRARADDELGSGRRSLTARGMPFTRNRSYY